MPRYDFQEFHLAYPRQTVVWRAAENKRNLWCTRMEKAGWLSQETWKEAERERERDRGDGERGEVPARRPGEVEATRPVGHILDGWKNSCGINLGQIARPSSNQLPEKCLST